MSSNIPQQNKDEINKQFQNAWLKWNTLSKNKETIKQLSDIYGQPITCIQHWVLPEDPTDDQTEATDIQVEGFTFFTKPQGALKNQAFLKVTFTAFGSRVYVNGVRTDESWRLLNFFKLRHSTWENQPMSLPGRPVVNFKGFAFDCDATRVTNK